MDKQDDVETRAEPDDKSGRVRSLFERFAALHFIWNIDNFKMGTRKK
jgi:hypothetical protein